MGREAPSRAQRPVPLHIGIAELGVDGGRNVADPTVRPDGVVVHGPNRKQFSGVLDRGEQRLVQQFIAQPPVKTLDEGVLCWLAWRDVVPIDVAFLETTSGSPCW